MHLFADSSALALFLTATIVLLVVPGPAVLYIVARSIDQGRVAGVVSAGGIATGALVHVLGAAFGLSALLVSSAAAFSAVKYVGAAYLVYLGIKKLREAPLDTEVGHVAKIPLRKVYSQGALVGALNPKTALFFFAFLPQFVDPARGHVAAQFLGLGMLFICMGVTSDSIWALAAGSAARWLRGRRILRHQRYVTGSVYIGLGIATAVSGGKHK